MEFTNGVATFGLKHDESKVATGLPVGLDYEVTEAANEEFTATSTGEKGTISSTPSAAHFRNVHDEGGFCVRKVLWSPVGAVACKKASARAWFGLLARIPQKTAYRWLDGLIDKARRTQSRWVRILMFPTPNREYGYLREWYENRAPIMFEGIEFSGVADAHSYLSFKFGDYGKLPPDEQRKTHPVTAIKLVKTVFGR
jgi:lipopolysaccharide cholinephosphotransferase